MFNKISTSKFSTYTLTACLLLSWIIVNNKCICWLIVWLIRVFFFFDDYDTVFFFVYHKRLPDFLITKSLKFSNCFQCS